MARGRSGTSRWAFVLVPSNSCSKSRPRRHEGSSLDRVQQRFRRSRWAFRPRYLISQRPHAECARTPAPIKISSCLRAFVLSWRAFAAGCDSPSAAENLPDGIGQQPLPQLPARRAAVAVVVMDRHLRHRRSLRPKRAGRDFGVDVGQRRPTRRAHGSGWTIGRIDTR